MHTCPAPLSLTTPAAPLARTYICPPLFLEDKHTYSLLVQQLQIEIRRLCFFKEQAYTIISVSIYINLSVSPDR